MSLKLNEVTKGKFDNISAGKFMEIEISKIFPNPDQPRKSFDDDYIEELSQSIKTNGLIQPIAVMKWAEKYMIISGECRWRACKKANLGTIKAHIITADMQKVEELSLIENIQRKDLTDFEIAQYINLLWKSGRYEKKKDLAAAIGKKDTYISKALSVFNLDDAIIEDMKENKHDISISVLDEISRSGDKDTQKLGYEKYKAGEITRDEIKNLKAPKEKDWNKDIWEANKKSVEDVKTSTGESETKLKKYLVEIKDTSTDTVYQEDTFEASFTNQALRMAYEKYPDDAKNEDLSFIVTLVEGEDYMVVETPNKRKIDYEIETFKDTEEYCECGYEIFYIGEAVKRGHRHDKYGHLKINDIDIFYGHSDTVPLFENQYYLEIYRLSVELEELKRKTKDTIEYENKEDLYIVSYAHKSGVPHGGGYRVWATNIDQAIEKGKEHYLEYAKDKKYFFNARPLNTFSRSTLFTIVKTYDEFEYCQVDYSALEDDIQKTLDNSSFDKFKITIEGK